VHIHPDQTITDLAQLSLIGTAAPGGNDSVSVSVGSHLYRAAPQSDDVLGLAGQWHDAEFNVFGDCCGSQAVFNYGSTIIVHLSVEDGTTNTPLCISRGYTGETNNLNLVGSCQTQGGSQPGITFKESNCNSRNLCGVNCCQTNEICTNPKTSTCKLIVGGTGEGAGSGSVLHNCGTPDTPPCNPTLPGQGGPKPKTIE